MLLLRPPSEPRIRQILEWHRHAGYGTLPEHSESGEELFAVEWREDDSVWYDLLAFSRERHPLAKMAYPLARDLQRRFRRDSGAAMQRAVGLER